MPFTLFAYMQVGKLDKGIINHAKGKFSGKYASLHE